MTTDRWISEETEPKERDFRGILGMHMRICQAIRSRYPGPPYLYADLYAGPGHLSHDGNQFLGSPLIFLDLAQRLQLPYEAICFEKDPDVARRLVEATKETGALPPQVYAARCEVGFSDWLSSYGRQPQRLGLIFSDPIHDEIAHRLLAKASAMLPKVDILTYVAATQYKRRRGADPTKPFLLDHVRAIGKKVVLIRRPHGAWHWTFILLSNWPNLPEWRKQGFYRLDSEVGEQIMDQLNLSTREHREASNTPLPFDDDPPYRTYREYLKHPRFLKIRAQVFARAAGVCERCRRRPPTEPHHLRYPPWGTFDVPENMIAICHPCHCEIHGKAS